MEASSLQDPSYNQLINHLVSKRRSKMPHRAQGDYYKLQATNVFYCMLQVVAPSDTDRFLLLAEGENIDCLFK